MLLFVLHAKQLPATDLWGNLAAEALFHQYRFLEIDLLTTTRGFFAGIHDGEVL